MVALEAQIDMHAYESAAIRQHLCGSTRATHRELVDRLVSQYSYLTRQATWTSRWQELYWLPMFTAIAVGLLCERRL